MRIQCTIHGVTPLLMHRFTDEAEVSVSSGHRPAVAVDDSPPRQEAEKFAYRDSEGGLYFPGPNIFAALVSAGKFHKLGKAKITTQKNSLVPAGLIVEDVVCPLGTKAFEVDSRRVVNPATGGARMRHRPRVDDWRLTFTMQVDETMFGEKLVRLLVDDAGQKVGIGNYRPERKGPFGRFVVESWQKVNAQ